jgi:hypothetical protein
LPDLQGNFLVSGAPACPPYKLLSFWSYLWPGPLQPLKLPQSPASGMIAVLVRVPIFAR